MGTDRREIFDRMLDGLHLRNVTCFYEHAFNKDLYREIAGISTDNGKASKAYWHI